MFPTSSIEIVSAEHSRRLEGYRTWSRRRNLAADSDVTESGRPVKGHRPTLRLAFGR